MKMLKRVGLFILTNILVVLTISLIIGLVSSYFKIDLQAGGYTGLFILCLIWGFAGSFISLLLSKWMAKTFHGVKVINPQSMNQTEKFLLTKVYEIARRAGMNTMPEVGFYESDEINAFATGPSESRALVAVSTGLMNMMNEAELEGVLAHEIAHIVNGDMITMTLIQGVVNSFAMFFAHILTMIIMNAFRRNDDDRRGGFGDFMMRQTIYSFASIALTLLGSIVVNYFSRQREFRADAGGARFSSPDKMSFALTKLQRVFDNPQPQMIDNNPQKGNDNLAVMKISGRKSGLSRLFMTHPPLEERIEAVRNRTYASSI
jgi:heat shock protein HtpX